MPASFQRSKPCHKVTGPGNVKDHSACFKYYSWIINIWRIWLFCDQLVNKVNNKYWQKVFENGRESVNFSCQKNVWLKKCLKITNIGYNVCFKSWKLTRLAQLVSARVASTVHKLQASGLRVGRFSIQCCRWAIQICTRISMSDSGFLFGVYFFCVSCHFFDKYL